jgi:hypothetical protein
MSGHRYRIAVGVRYEYDDDCAIEVGLRGGGWGKWVIKDHAGM